MKFRSLFIITPIIFLLAFSLASAQLTGPDTSSVDLAITPQNPRPNQSVTANLVSYSIDINRADVTWSINGKQVAAGKGLKTFSFTTGSLGTKTSLEVLIVSEDGYPILKDLSINPASVNLLVEATSYTPPFYRGEAYFPYQGTARVIAVPSFVDDSGKQIPASNLIFNWKDGTRNLTDASGIGRNILNYKGSVPIRTGTVSVEVSSLDQKSVAEGNVNIEPVEPSVVLYENDPEYGVLYNKALASPVNLNKGEMTVVAVPYYFDVLDPGDYNLNYQWNVSGSSVNSSGDSIVLKNPSSGGGQANLSLQLSNTTDIFQFASAALDINFGASAKSIFNPFSR